MKTEKEIDGEKCWKAEKKSPVKEKMEGNQVCA